MADWLKHDLVFAFVIIRAVAMSMTAQGTDRVLALNDICTFATGVLGNQRGR